MPSSGSTVAAQSGRLRLLVINVAGASVVRNDFSDPQRRKRRCDRQAATIKGDVGQYIKEGNNVTSAKQLKTAIESGKGTIGVNASFVVVKTPNIPSIKWYGISLLNNFEYEESGIRVRRAFDGVQVN